MWCCQILAIGISVAYSRNINSAPRINKNATYSCLSDPNGKILGIEEQLHQWKVYVENEFKDSRAVMPDMHIDDGPDITKDEIEYVIRQIKNGKATGPDEIHGELLKPLVNGSAISALQKLFNMIYKTGNMPLDWLKSTFITIPKKVRSKSCSDHRIISLMSHVLKLFLNIIHKRIYAKCEDG